MSKYLTLTLLLTVIVVHPVFSQNLVPGSHSAILTPQSVGTPAYGNYGYPAGNPYGGTPVYNNPYNTMYGGYYNPYYPTYQGRYNIGGISTPVYGTPQLLRDNFYGINAGGMPAQFWRAPSGFYYPWVGGYRYSSYPIYGVAPTNGSPMQTLPPIKTVISDLDSYLDKAKENGKINAGDYESLRLRANDLLSKEKSLAYEEGGVIDPESEAEIRRDVEGLSAEIAHRVKP